MTITANIMRTIESINIVLPMLCAALSRRDPIPSTEYVLFPNTRYSATRSDNLFNKPLFGNKHNSLQKLLAI